MPKTKDIQITAEMLNKIAEIDTFNGMWNAGGAHLSVADLKVMKRIATIESVGSSNRIEGNKMSDEEVEELFTHINQKSFASRDEQEVDGYSNSVAAFFKVGQKLLD